MLKIANQIDNLPRIKKISLEDVFHSEWIDLKRGKTRYVLRANESAEYTVVLAPDPPNTIEQMKPLIDLLAHDFQVLAFDTLGFGYSSTQFQYQYSMEHHAGVTIEVLEKLDVDNAILGFTCVAALPALLAAKKRPDLIKGLVLGQAPSIDESKRWARRVDFKGLMRTPFVGQLALKLLKSKVTSIWYTTAFPAHFDTSAMTQDTQKSFKRGARFSLASALQALFREAVTADDLTVLQPTILLWGELDKSHKKTNPEKTLEMLPNGSLTRIPQCGHFPDIEAPEEFAAALREVASRI